MVEHNSLINFMFEVAKLKLVPRSGWLSAGVKNPESIADHSSSSTFIAFVLAKMERADPYKAATMAAMRGLSYTRINDQDAVGRKYIGKEVDASIIEEQLKLLPEDVAKEMANVVSHKDDSKESIVARDADLLEMLIQAVIYKDSGYKNVQHWLDEIPGRLKTETAKALSHEIIKSNSYDWSRHLKVLKR